MSANQSQLIHLVMEHACEHVRQLVIDLATNYNSTGKSRSISLYTILCAYVCVQISANNLSRPEHVDMPPDVKLIHSA